MTSIRVSLTIVCALMLSLAFALPVTAQPPCAVCGGEGNTRVGSNALVVNTGTRNTAIGSGALNHNTTGSSNTAIGLDAGFFLTTGTHNIHIGNAGNEADANLIRIGDLNQTRTFIAGIFGADVLGKALPVEVNSLGQLGTTISSRRVKDDIRDMDEASAGLGKLRPVTFHYKAE
jgi:hypothetical protein